MGKHKFKYHIHLTSLPVARAQRTFHLFKLTLNSSEFTSTGFIARNCSWIRAWAGSDRIQTRRQTGVQYRATVRCADESRGTRAMLGLMVIDQGSDPVVVFPVREAPRPHSLGCYQCTSTSLFSEWNCYRLIPFICTWNFTIVKTLYHCLTHNQDFFASLLVR